MRKTVYKLFWLWDFEKEEKWLNEMAAKGLSLINVGFCRYDFIETNPGEYIIRLEMLDNFPNNPESQKYIQFIEDTGAEHIGTLFRWTYFRKKTEDSPFDLYNDIDSRIKHLKRIIWIPVLFGFINLFNAINMTKQFIQYRYNSYIVLMVLCWIISMFMLYGFIRIFIKKHSLKKERFFHE